MGACWPIRTPGTSAAMRANRASLVMTESDGRRGWKVTPASAAGSADSLDLLEPHEHVTRLRTVGRPQYACRVKLVDDAGCAAVADLETPLKERGRPLLMLDDHFCC